ncbi:NAD(P)/FAD-dependent oxidoreductase [Clostridium cylindrosporum]|uniref:NADH-dependent phenylglyoxylate dehydrogenase subunit epsilon n=1 Tax=Clostridium cylindrosporum DSM 605 TaxID=1121307 RepID=A0A0J8DD07_CLOCY|nr:FAD-dependent oxidoreductase [Clostridium cylindrosporum]KMT22138.1 NADH-dependent phenylglyoxylate dehydrogenase subunit epsilon [Clostridium cylindrosporum DSM 605]
MRYVVIGASASGINGAKTLREIDKNAEIILISKDEYVYSRCILHHYISGHRDVEDLNFSDKNYFEKYNIKCIKCVEVVRLYAKKHEIHLSDGRMINYDKVLISSGASAFIPPIENLREANNVIGLRNLDDAVRIKEIASNVENVVVIGAGLVGIDAISGLMDSGVKITLAEANDRILGIQLDEYAASKYQELFKEKGVDLKLSIKVEKLIVDENNNPKQLLISTGEKIPCELVVVATGVRANIAFLEGSGVEVDKFGLIIDERGETNIKDIYGAGDVTGRNPIWPTAVKEGIIAASNMAGINTVMTDFFGSKNTMNFFGLPTMSVGMINAPDESYKEEIQIEGNNYKKIIHKDGKIYGAIIQGDLSYTGILTQLIKEEIDISKVKKPLFKIDYSDFFNIKENLEYTY